jgi:hypothetical protein
MRSLARLAPSAESSIIATVATSGRSGRSDSGKFRQLSCVLVTVVVYPWIMRRESGPPVAWSPTALIPGSFSRLPAGNRPWEPPLVREASICLECELHQPLGHRELGWFALEVVLGHPAGLAGHAR